MATDNHLPDWDENQLSLGKPVCMDTPTLIEWIQRQLETLDEHENRIAKMREDHAKWHETAPGIFGCCISGMTFGVNGILKVNESRSERLYEEALQAFRSYSEGSSQVMYLPEGVEVTSLYADNVKYSEIIHDNRPSPGIIRDW